MSTPRQLDQLRPDVQVLRIGPRTFRLYDPQSGAHYELGATERYLLSLLQSSRTVEELCENYQRQFGRPLPEREAREFMEQLRRQCLLVGTETNRPPLGDEIPHRSALPIRLRGEWANVFFDVLTLLFGWLLHPVWLLLAVPLGLLLVGVIVGDWHRLWSEIAQARRELPLVPLVAAVYLKTILLLNLPVAVLMGVCCRKFRGRVRSFGLTWGNWVLPTVSFFTDIGESIVGMPPRGRRTQIALGIVLPLALGGLYTLLWLASSRAHDAHQFWSLMILPSAAIALYQCNPFSIYSTAHWALASALDDWRLHGRALDETRAWLWGRTSPEPLTRRERRWLRAYGLVHYAIRLVADVGLLGGSLYLITRLWGAPGAAVLLVLFAWWNRDHLRPLWNFSGLSIEELWGRWAAARAK
jgi:hypothetical protein